MQYNFVEAGTERLTDRQDQPEIKLFKVTLVDLHNSSVRYALKPGNMFAPLAMVPYLHAWKHTIPTTVPKGEYQLIFRDARGNYSLPHYRKITIR